MGQFGSYGCFCWGHEGGKAHWTVRCQARLILIRFASMAWSPASDPMILDLPDLVCLSRFLQPKQNISNHLVTVLWSTEPSSFTTNVFGYFCGIIAQTELIKHTLLTETVVCSSVWLSNHTHRLKQWILCQCTNYQDITNLSLNCISHVIYVLQTSMLQNMAKLLTYPSILAVDIRKDRYTEILPFCLPSIRPLASHHENHPS